MAYYLALKMMLISMFLMIAVDVRATKNDVVYEVEIITEVVEEFTTTASTPTTLPATTTTQPPPTPWYPEATYPEVRGPGGSDVFREILVEVAVIYDACDPFDDPGSAPCVELIDAFKTFAEGKYKDVTGFQDVVAGELKSGSVIIPHTVSYNYNDMDGEDKELSADEIYERTIGQSVVDEEEFGDEAFKFTSECSKCETPTEQTELCDSDEYEAECSEGMDSVCADNVWVCQSPCEKPEDDPYCSEKSAKCTQRSAGESPSCLCLQSEDGWYIGARCQVYLDRLVLILVVSIGGGLLLLLILVLCVCLCRTKKELQESRQLPFEQYTSSFIRGKGELELSDTRHTLYDNAGYDDMSIDGDYPKGASSFNPELEKAAKESADKRNSQYFWGNLAEDVIDEPEQLMSTKVPNENGKGHAANGKANGSGPIDADFPDPYSKRYSKS